MLTPAMQWIESQLPVMTERLIHWSNQNSWSYHLENLREMSAVLRQAFEAVGFPMEAVELPPFTEISDNGGPLVRNTGPLLVARHRPTAARQILLMIHYDTVYPPLSQPATCQTVGDRLVGPGVADAKGGIVVLLSALEAVARFHLLPDDVGCTVVLNPDEEIGSPGSRGWLRQHVHQFELGLLFEPAFPDGQLVANRKGSGNYTVIVHGRSAHSGRDPAAGRNAVMHLSRLLIEVDALADATQGTTINVARIQGGGPLNRVPDLAVARWNVRVMDPTVEIALQSKFEQLVARYQADGFRLELHGGFHAPVKRLDESGRLLQMEVDRAARRVGRTLRWCDSGGACDGSQLAAWGLPNIDTLGATGGNLHSPDEYCELEALVPAVQTLAAILHEPPKLAPP